MHRTQCKTPMMMKMLLGGVRQASILHSKKTGHEAKKGIDKKVH
jgi:hypothetical protein